MITEKWTVLLADSNFPTVKRCANSAIYLDTPSYHGILVFGGYDGSNFLDTCLFFNLSKNQWEKFETNGVVKGVSSFCCCLWHNRMLVFGGVGRSDSSLYELYLPTKTWSVIWTHSDLSIQEVSNALVGDRWYIAVSNTLKYLDLTDMTWHIVGILPGTIGANAAMCYDYQHGFLYYSGGKNGAFESNLWRVSVPAMVLCIPLLFKLQQRKQFVDIHIQCSN